MPHSRLRRSRVGQEVERFGGAREQHAEMCVAKLVRRFTGRIRWLHKILSYAEGNFGQGSSELFPCRARAGQTRSHRHAVLGGKDLMTEYSDVCFVIMPFGKKPVGDAEV